MYNYKKASGDVGERGRRWKKKKGQDFFFFFYVYIFASLLFSLCFITLYFCLLVILLWDFFLFLGSF